MGFKVFILLVWLAVPATLGAMLRADMQRYEAESRTQEALCHARADLLARHALLLGHQADGLPQTADEIDLRNWRRAWSDAKRDAQRELPPLAAGALTHYPATAALLQKEQEALDRLVKGMDDAERDRGYFLRGQGVLIDLAQQSDYLNDQARYFSMLPNGREIYLLLEEQLATLETRYQAQDNEQTRLDNAVRRELAQANGLLQEIQAGLRDVPARLAQDGSRTYFENIRARWDAFDLRGAVADLITQAVQPAAPPPGRPPPGGRHPHFPRGPFRRRF